MHSKSILVTALAILAVAVFAGDNKWQQYGGSYDGDYADPNHWDLGRVPAAGDVANGTLDSPTFGVTVANDGTAETLFSVGSGVSVTGRAQVDLGRAPDDPLSTVGPFPVLHYAGAAPDVSSWKLRNAGMVNARGQFTAADGTVSVKIEIVGTTLIFR